MKDCQLCSNQLQIAKVHLKEKYQQAFQFYQTKQINEILLNKNSDVVIQFKEFLFIDDNSYYLKRFYSSQDIKKRHQGLLRFYMQVLPPSKPITIKLNFNQILFHRNQLQEELHYIAKQKEGKQPTGDLDSESELNKDSLTSINSKKSEPTQYLDKVLPQSQISVLQTQQNSFQVNTYFTASVNKHTKPRRLKFESPTFQDESYHNKNLDISFESEEHDIYNPEFSDCDQFYEQKQNFDEFEIFSGYYDVFEDAKPMNFQYKIEDQFNSIYNKTQAQSQGTNNCLTDRNLNLDPTGKFLKNHSDQFKLLKKSLSNMKQSSNLKSSLNLLSHRTNTNTNNYPLLTQQNEQKNDCFDYIRKVIKKNNMQHFQQQKETQNHKYKSKSKKKHVQNKSIGGIISSQNNYVYRGFSPQKQEDQKPNSNSFYKTQRFESTKGSYLFGYDKKQEVKKKKANNKSMGCSNFLSQKASTQRDLYQQLQQINNEMHQKKKSLYKNSSRNSSQFKSNSHLQKSQISKNPSKSKKRTITMVESKNSKEKPYVQNIQQYLNKQQLKKSHHEFNSNTNVNVNLNLQLNLKQGKKEITQSKTGNSKTKAKQFLQNLVQQKIQK